METQNEFHRLNGGKSGWRVRLGRRGQVIRSKLFGKKSIELGRMENSHSPSHGDSSTSSTATPEPESSSYMCTSSENTYHPEALNMALSADTLDSDNHIETCQIPVHNKWIFGRVLDPRSRAVQEWNRFFLLVCGIGLAIDPLFFYALSVSEKFICLYVDGWFAIAVTVLRSATDAMHLWNIWLQLKLAYVSKESLVVGSGKLVTDPRSIALKYLGSRKGFLFDVFVILPFPQMVLWALAPVLIEKGDIVMVMSVFLIMFLFQYLPKVYHSIYLLRRMQHVTGYVFGTIWAGFALNVLAYFVAANAAGACWYLLGIQRAAKCLQKQCEVNKGCDFNILGCVSPIFYSSSLVRNPERLAWRVNNDVHAICIKGDGRFNYGAYKWVVPLVTNTNRIEKILFPIFWGLMTLSTFGNLESTTEWLEVVFNIIVLTSGLLLVTMLIGNIKVFLHAATSRKQSMQLRMRNTEWWMRRRQLPQRLRQRVRHYERQKWAAMRGVDESAMIHNLPEGLRRDIKYHLCLDLVRQVPLFQHMDDLVLENICDRVKSMLFTTGERITREGDPVQRMLFIVRGHFRSTNRLTNGVTSTCMLGPGNFCGDELLSWCLRRPFVQRLPLSSATITSVETTEAFGLDAKDLKYITQHFRYTFLSDKLKRTAKYYSPGWRTWAAVAIQLAWRRYKARFALSSLSFVRMRRPLSRSYSEEDRLRLYAALLASPKPQNEDFVFPSNE
ncbi:hypothetical protein SUGI_0665180 [Cryptomeria japonica]|uniref:cyclic nucleotide-gated ion channel 4 isoform X2 n=1 Tax=Cryptomeria japonica TaxID=3369 RepID=UPI002414C5D9|nr:cyclic nucleotide-gated ion channel 4 isoform X2 [Cryptomeria japonica]GLJ33050.1 hypothetical protein SUGI_0665180 [Cryptomeria japonica]